jgi:ABC-type uncharacterized transport system permease subunit
MLVFSATKEQLVVRVRPPSCVASYFRGSHCGTTLSESLNYTQFFERNAELYAVRGWLSALIVSFGEWTMSVRVEYVGVCVCVCRRLSMCMYSSNSNIQCGGKATSDLCGNFDA